MRRRTRGRFGTRGASRVFGFLNEAQLAQRVHLPEAII
jgi:hypothetical protein